MTTTPTTESNRANRFLRACRGEPVDTTPIWIMRQAGRYLPDYRRTRAKAGDFLTLCKTPDLACEVTLQPVDILGVDAAIIFSDILTMLEPMGVGLSFGEGEGPRLEPIRTEAQVDKVFVPDPEVGNRFLMDAIRQTVRGLDGKVPLIGFAGAPWTLFSYAIEGKTSKGWTDAKRMLFEAPALAHRFLEKITQYEIVYLEAQVKAGARVVQVFDSWAGALGPEEYRTFALPYVKRIVAALQKTGVPVIYFCNEGAALYADAVQSGADVIGCDFRTPLDDARARMGERGSHVTLQGNLDPSALFSTLPDIERRVVDVLQRGRVAGSGRHIFNLGHGILPPTNPEHAIALVEMVHRHGREGASK